MTSLSFFAFRQPQKGGFARAVKDKGGLSARCSFLTRGKYCCIELPAIYVPIKTHTAGIFSLRYFPVLDGAGKNPQ